MKCNKKGCEVEAIGAVRINVPATGVSLAQHEPATALLALVLCPEHMAEAREDVAMFVSEPLKESLRGAVLRKFGRGVKPPDFEQAFISTCPFESQEWKQFVKLKGYTFE